MKQLEFYDFNLAAGQSRDYPVQGDYVRVISATGDINIIGDTFGKLGPVRAGQGLAKTKYNRLTVQNVSGAPNVGKILVSESNFIDQTLFGSFGLDAATLLALEQVTANTRPEAPTSTYSTSGALAANTPIQVFGAGSNPNGAILLNAHISWIDTTGINHIAAWLASGGPPTTPSAGSVLLQVGTTQSQTATLFMGHGNLQIPQFISPGNGLYFIDSNAEANAFNNARSCRYRLL